MKALPPAPRFGAHMSIAGGYFRAVDAAAEAGCDCVQLFTKNSNQWRAKPISDEEAAAFREALSRTGISDPVSHASYLINLASPDDLLWRKSVDGMTMELERAGKLGIPWVIVHPGASTTGTEEEGLARVVAALKELLDGPAAQAGILLENTAGQGSTLGRTLEQLAAMLDGVGKDGRVGVCIDTCHAFAAGYDIGAADGYGDFLKQLDRLIGIERVQAIHLNDSKKGCGSRVDRHEHIGEGAIGLEAFRMLVNDTRLRRVPMYLETEKGDRRGESLDAINLRTLRNLVRDS